MLVVMQCSYAGLDQHYGIAAETMGGIRTIAICITFYRMMTELDSENVRRYNEEATLKHDSYELALELKQRLIGKTL